MDLYEMPMCAEKKIHPSIRKKKKASKNKSKSSFLNLHKY